MKPKKKCGPAGITLLLLAVLAAASLILHISLPSDLPGYESRWGLSMPLKLKQQYSASDPGFTGDGIRYTVFIAKEIPSGFFSDYRQKKEPEMESYVNRIAGELRVGEKDRPDFSKSYRYKRYEDGTDSLVILFNDQNFYFIEKRI